MATIIKAHATEPRESGARVAPLAFNLDDLTTRAERYLAEVRQQAASILADAQSEADSIRKRAEADGREAALRAVDQVMEEKVRTHMKTLLPALTGAVAQLEQQQAAWLNHWQKSAVRVACEIAGRIVRREISQCPQITLELIGEALHMAAGSAELTLRLNPSDFEHLGGQVRTLAEKLDRIADVAVIPDDSVTPGGCRLDTRFGAIDQQIESQLARIEEELG